MMFVRCLAAMLCAAVTACAGGSTQTAQTATCRIEQVADVPVQMVQGHSLAPADINYTPVQLVIDTGSSLSLLTPEAAYNLQLPADSYRTTALHGIGGTVMTHGVTVRSLKIGSQDWQGGSIATGALGTQYRQSPPVVGILGADHLEVFDVELDIPHHHMVLWRVQNCEDDFVPWRAPHFVVHLGSYRLNRLTAHIQVDGHPMTALVDWGSSSTVMTATAAATLGVTPAMLAQDRSGSSLGADRNEVPMHLHRFTGLTIGPETFRNVTIMVGDLNVTDVGMLLGTDYVTSRHIWLSYATNQMFVEPNAVAGPTTLP